MGEAADNVQIVRHSRLVVALGLTASVALVAFRTLIELGFGPKGSLRVAGLPLEYLMLAWYLGLFPLAFDKTIRRGAIGLRAVAYEFWWGIVGLAGMLWIGRQLILSRLVYSTAGVYWLAAASAFVVFLSAAAVNRSTTSELFRNVFADAWRIVRRPTTVICAIGVAALLTAAPRSMEIPIRGAAFERWYMRQRPVAIPRRWQSKPVTLVELVDYQCPASREAATRYERVLSDAEAKYPSSFALFRIDFPLDDECNPAGASGSGAPRHPAACEAAVAVRVAAEEGPARARAVVRWLWAHQARLTPNLVFEGMRREFGIDIRSLYPEMLRAISVDAQSARELQVSATPTYFLNGRRLPPLLPETMEAAIALQISLSMDTSTAEGR